MSLVRRHLARHAQLAAQAAAGGGALAEIPTNAPERSAYELMLAQLDADRRRLKDVQSTERKVELKRRLLPAYTDWIVGALAAGAAGAAAQDEVVAEIMIWTIDVGDIAAAMPIIRHVLAHGLALPARFNRQPATLIVEQCAEAALAALATKSPFPLLPLLEIEELTAARDVFDQVRAKLHKAIGQLALREAEAPDQDRAGYSRVALDLADQHLRRALALDAKSGVKKDIERVEREIRKLPAGEAGAENKLAPAAGGAEAEGAAQADAPKPPHPPVTG